MRDALAVPGWPRGRAAASSAPIPATRAFSDLPMAFGARSRALAAALPPCPRCGGSPGRPCLTPSVGPDLGAPGLPAPTGRQFGGVNHEFFRRTAGRTPWVRKKEGHGLGHVLPCCYASGPGSPTALVPRSARAAPHQPGSSPTVVDAAAAEVARSGGASRPRAASGADHPVVAPLVRGPRPGPGRADGDRVPDRGQRLSRPERRHPGLARRRGRRPPADGRCGDLAPDGRRAPALPWSFRPHAARGRGCASGAAAPHSPRCPPGAPRFERQPAPCPGRTARHRQVWAARPTVTLRGRRRRCAAGGPRANRLRRTAAPWSADLQGLARWAAARRAPEGHSCRGPSGPACRAAMACARSDPSHRALARPSRRPRGAPAHAGRGRGCLRQTSPSSV